MRTIGLRPLTAAEYDEWVPRAIAVYAAEHARAGSRPADRALAMAEQEFAELLPDGVETTEHHLLVGELAGERVGLLWLRIPVASSPSDQADGVSAFVYDVEVDAAARGKGYGRGLMLAAEPYARDRGAGVLKLHVFGSNTVARGLYESLGYETTNVSMAKMLL